MMIRMQNSGALLVALHPEGVDRNQSAPNSASRRPWSPSTRRAWIEISQKSVDRALSTVALHPEGVDRNKALDLACQRSLVALHPEGVDRNLSLYRYPDTWYVSPSTRRAWIEIHPPRCII